MVKIVCHHQARIFPHTVKIRFKKEIKASNKAKGPVSSLREKPDPYATIRTVTAFLKFTDDSIRKSLQHRRVTFSIIDFIWH